MSTEWPWFALMRWPSSLNANPLVTRGPDLLQLLERKRRAMAVHGLQQFLHVDPTGLSELQSHSPRLMPQNQGENLAGLGYFFVGHFQAHCATLNCNSASRR